MLLKTTHHLKPKAQYSCRSTTNFSTKFSIQLYSCIEILTKFSTYYREGWLEKGHLVTRITVTLSVFIFSTRFLVQNCRESQGASF
jgi:hypothetical protein